APWAWTTAASCVPDCAPTSCTGPSPIPRNSATGWAAPWCARCMQADTGFAEAYACQDDHADAAPSRTNRLKEQLFHTPGYAGESARDGPVPPINHGP